MLPSMSRMASTAAWSAASLSPRPDQRAAASAAYSVTRTSSSARLRLGAPSGGSAVEAPASAACAPAPSLMRAGPLKRAGRLASSSALGLAHHACDADQQGAEDADEVADAEGDVDIVLGLSEDDPVDDDERERGDADDHRDLARAPGELVGAGDDPAENEGRGAGSEQPPPKHVEGVERVRAVAAPHPRGLEPRVHVLGAGGRREPRQEQ